MSNKTVYIAVYGLEFHATIKQDNLELIPDSTVSPKLALDEQYFHLTGWGKMIFPDIDDMAVGDRIYQFQNLLTFYQGRKVMVVYSTGSKPDSLSQFKKKCCRKFKAYVYRGPNFPIGPSQYLADFLQLLLPQSSSFSSGINRAIQARCVMLEMQKRYAEIEYFLLWFPFEALVKEEMCIKGTLKRQHLIKFLGKIGISANNSKIEDFFKMRGEIFHSGKVQDELMKRSTMQKLEKLINICFCKLTRFSYPGMSLDWFNKWWQG